MDKFILVTWPESQELMELPDFKKRCCLAYDTDFLEANCPGNESCTYFVDEDWLGEMKSLNPFLQDILS